MIDYLEEALTEDREEGLPARGRRVAVRSPEKIRAAEPDETEGNRVPVPEPAEEGAVSAEEMEEEAPGPALASVESETEDIGALISPEEWVEPELRAALLPDRHLRAEEAGDAAGVLLQALSRTGRSLRALRSGTGIMTVTLPDGGGETAGGPDLEALDLAMQRDARRYDGGFPLY